MLIILKNRAMGTFSKICQTIEDSPLKFIKGECRLLHLEPDDWNNFLKDEYFFITYPSKTRTISFSHGSEYLGDLVIERLDLKFAQKDEKGNLSMRLDIESDGLVLVIKIKCKSKFPGLNEFAKFVAYTVTQILI